MKKLSGVNLELPCYLQFPLDYGKQLQCENQTTQTTNSLTMIAAGVGLLALIVLLKR